MIYLDNAATTAVCKEAKEAMVPLLEDEYGNPSANYPLEIGQEVSSKEQE